MALIIRLLCLLSSADLIFAKDEAVVLVVDPTWDDVASFVSHVPLLQEYKIVKVVTRLGKLQSFAGGHADIYRTFTYNSLTASSSGAADEICPLLRSMGVPVAAVIPTSDGTVALTDQLAACVGAKGNPFEGPLAKARRDKWAMGEAVRKAGLRSVKEKVVSTWNEAKEFLETMSPPLSHSNPVIFKILTGAGGEGINKVYSLKQAEEIFDSETGSKGQFGESITKILIQEFLSGKEYAVDTVSRDGVHKVVQVWFEDFRPANGIFDQYFGFKVLDPKDPFTMVLVDYANKVLDAVGLANGAANTEVKFLEDEGQPCLVEVNARWAGLGWTDGLAVEKATVGQDQITAAFTSYLDGAAFDAMPPVLPIKKHGAMIFTVNYNAGILKGVPGLAAARQCPSYLSESIEECSVGKFIPKTSPNNIPIEIALAHDSQAVVDADYDRIIHLVKSGAFFDVKPAQLTALRADSGGSPGSWLPAIAAVAMLAVAVIVLALTAKSRRNVPDGTEYITIE